MMTNEQRVHALYMQYNVKPLWVCDPAKNIHCGKSVCQSVCVTTTYREFALTQNGIPVFNIPAMSLEVQDRLKRMIEKERETLFSDNSRRKNYKWPTVNKVIKVDTSPQLKPLCNKYGLCVISPELCKYYTNFYLLTPCTNFSSPASFLKQE